MNSVQIWILNRVLQKQLCILLTFGEYTKENEEVFRGKPRNMKGKRQRREKKNKRVPEDRHREEMGQREEDHVLYLFLFFWISLFLTKRNCRYAPKMNTCLQGGEREDGQTPPVFA